MKHLHNYNIFDEKKIVLLIALMVFAAAVGFAVGSAVCEEVTNKPLSCWVLCKPGSQVNIRMRADKHSREVGFLEAGDEFRTDGVCRNGFVHALGVGDNGEGWVYCGFVVTEKPEKVFEPFYCVARSRAACRRWVEGPQVSGRSGWLYNGTTVQVFYITGDWACTSRGYIKSEWLEPDP